MTCARLLALCAAVLLPMAAMAESIEGEVNFTGKAPTPGKLHREADPYCAKKPMTDPAVLVKGGKLENVWVHVTKGAKDEGMMKWKCDVHPWMRGYIGISKNGLQAISSDSGSFKIDNVPPGKYTVEAWHEKYGTKTQEVTVEAGKPAKVIFKYDGTEKGGA